MNVTTISTGTGTGTGTGNVSTQHASTINTKTYKIEMLDDGQLSMASDDDDDDLISSDGSMYGDGDFVQMSAQDDVANQLAAAGPVGVAAAAAIASSKKRKRAHSFETNPSVRKRQQNRLLRKLRGIIYEFTGRVGKQAVVLVATPGKPNTSYKVFGAKPLEDVVRNLKNIVMDELENALAQQAPPAPQEDPSLFELPPLIIDGIPTPVEKMTQAQLRAFIPLMLKYSTGRGKPGWGRESTRPPWWPKELPWANVRMDARSEDDKQKISWTHALRKIVINCYKYHGREDLLPTFADDEEKIELLTGDEEEMEEPTTTTTTVQTVANAATNTTNQVNVVKINSAGTVITTHTANAQNQNNAVPTIIQSTNNQHVTTTATLPASTKIEICAAPASSQATANAQQTSQQQSNVANNAAVQTIANAQYNTQTVLSTIQNADGTVSFIQVDPNNPIITLPDGTTAQVQGVATLHQGDGTATIQTVQSLADVNGHENMTVDLTEATVAQDGQIYITAEDGQGYPVSVSNMITLPVSASMYQSMLANIQQIHTNSDGTVCLTPMQVHTQSNINNNSNTSTNTNNNSNSNNSTNTNNNSNTSGHYQCYTITASPGGLGERLVASNQNMPSTVNQNQTNVANNNTTRCQIFNQSRLSNNASQQNNSSSNRNSNSNSNNNHQHRQSQQQLQQQPQQNQSVPATTKIYITGSAANFNINSVNLTNINSSNNNNNNNTSTTNNNTKLGNCTGTTLQLPITALPLPIVLSTAGASTGAGAGRTPATRAATTVASQMRTAAATTTTTATTSIGTIAVTSKRISPKRRKQTFGKVAPIKRERSNGSAEGVLNIQIVDSDGADVSAGAAVGTGNVCGDSSSAVLLTKTIKLENLEN